MAPFQHEQVHGVLERALDDPAESPSDPRVRAVLEVLGGAPRAEVAQRWSVDADVLGRWVSAFVESGTAQVLNRPESQTLAQRDRFLAAFSLEIRNPLSVALGWSGLLAEGDLSPMAFVRTARRLQEALVLLADRLVDVELLVAAAMGGLQVERQRVTAAQVCAVPDVGVIGGAGPATVLCVDPDLFSRIVGDLWQAAALAPAPRSRRIEVEVRDPWIEVRIVREGDPIDVDLLRAMFDPFDVEQLSSGVSTGLYLARALTVAHGGTLGMDQDDDRAVMWVRVPLRPESAEPAAPRSAPHHGGS